MFSLFLLAALAQPPAPGPDARPLDNDGTKFGVAPEQGLAAIDPKGNLTFLSVKPVCGYLMPNRDVELDVPGKKGKENVAAKAKVATMQLTVVELPAKYVEAYTVAGKPIAAAKLAGLLAKERTVLFALDGKKVDPLYLPFFKEGTIILVPRGNLYGTDYGWTPAPKAPDNPIPPKEAPAPKQGPKKSASASAGDPARAGEVSASAGDKKEDAPARGTTAAALRIRDQLPRSVPASVSEVTMKDGVLVAARPGVVLITLQKKVVVQRDGRPVEVVQKVNAAFTRFFKASVKAEAVKAFVVTKEGKLEPLDAAGLPGRFKEPTRVLIGECADLNPRHLELIRPGTVYLAIRW